MSFSANYLKRVGFISIKRRNAFGVEYSNVYGLGLAFHNEFGYQAFCQLYQTINNLGWDIFTSLNDGVEFNCDTNEQYDAVNNLVIKFIHSLDKQMENQK